MRFGRGVLPALIATIMSVPALAFAASATFAVGPPSGFAGTWTTIDCAQWWEEPHIVDCAFWGDASELTLGIGPGSTPAVTFHDAFASVCANSGSRTTRWVAAGTGEFDDTFFWPTYTKSGCGTFGMGGYSGDALYHDPGSDTLWEDPDGDGWGYIWYRAPGGPGRVS